MKIIIDVMGGDNPQETVKGALLAVKKNPDVSFVFVGDEKLIKKVASEENASLQSFSCEFSDDVILNNESPTMAIKSKKNSSLVKAFSAVNDKDSIGLISTGSTGAVLTGGTLLVGRLPKIYRPTLVTQLPTLSGDGVCVSDSGANVDCRPEWLLQFAIMSSAYYTAVTGKEKPSVALLNVGTENHKGNELTHAVTELLEKSDLNFVGNMEARDIFTGKYDVVVCDGFDGNVLLKSAEGTASMILKSLKRNVKSSLLAKFGYLFMRSPFDKLRKQMDFNTYGGAPFLGIKKCVIKSHGASSALSILNAVGQVLKLYYGNVIGAIERKVAT